MTERARSDGRAGLAIASEPPNPGSETDTAEMSVGQLRHHRLERPP